MATYSKELESKLKKHNWEQSLLAHKTGLSQGCISKILSGSTKNPTRLTRKLIAEAFGEVNRAGTPFGRASPDDVRNVLFRCDGLDEWDIKEIMQLVESRMERHKKGEKRVAGGRSV